MLRRRFTPSLTALLGLLLLQFGMRAEADYGVETTRPLSDPHQAGIDNRTVGTWRTIIQNKTYYLHIGTGNIVGKSNWMELVLVNAGEKPLFYVHHKIGFPSTIGGQSYFNVANLSVLISQLRGTTTQDLSAAVERYDILKYDVTEDYLDVWPAKQEFIRESITAGKIKGTEATINDTIENLSRFMSSSDAQLFGDKIRYLRVK